MPLTLVLGPANSAKAGEVLGAYAAAARRDALLVVPTAADAVHYDHELSEPGITLGRALTFSGLVEEIARRVTAATWQPQAGLGRTMLTALQREQLIRRAVASQPMSALSSSAARPGFALAAGRLIAELRGARVTGPRFAAAIGAWARAGGSDRAAYARDLAALYRSYLAALEQVGRTDAEGFAWDALDGLRADPGAWQGTPVFFYGFDDLTLIEQDAIETLARTVDAEVTVSLTFERDRSALTARAEVVENLREWALAVRELPPLDEYYEPGSRAVLHHLERYLFEPSPAQIDGAGVISLLEAGGERAEAELIASEVLAALRDGVPASEIVVVCRSLHRSGSLLTRTLRRYGVAVSAAIRTPVAHTALGRALLALARCALDRDAAASDLLAYLRAPGQLDSPEAVDALAAEIARGGVTTASDARRLPHARGLPLGAIDELRRAQAPTAVLAAQARRLLAALGPGAAPQLSEPEALDARAAAAVLVALREAAELQPLDGAELIDLLRTIEVNLVAGAGPEAVLVAEPLAIRARRFRRVIVAGLCEGEFPSPTDAGDPFLGEDRRRELALASGLALGTEPDPLARERYLLYACVSRATERVCLSYRSSDEDGKLVLASPFLEDFDELLGPGWRQRRRQRLLADVVWSPQDAPTQRERELASVASGCVPPGSPAGVAGDPDLAAGPGSGPTRRLGEVAMQHVRHGRRVSAGALELFASCPVKWLVERQLQPGALAPDAEALARGSFMHELLAQVFARLEGALTLESLPVAQGVLAELTLEPPPNFEPGRPQTVRLAMLRGIEADLRRYLTFEAASGNDWTPTELELEFTVELGAGEDPVDLYGFVDRVDVEPGGRRAIVWDYKSGTVSVGRARSHWLDDHQLQVALYMLAVRSKLGLEPVAGFYQPLRGAELRPRGAFASSAPVGERVYRNDGLEDHELAELLSEIEAEAVALARQIRTGELTPCPQTCSRGGCQFPGICWAG